MHENIFKPSLVGSGVEPINSFKNIMNNNKKRKANVLRKGHSLIIDSRNIYTVELIPARNGVRPLRDRLPVVSPVPCPPGCPEGDPVVSGLQKEGVSWRSVPYGREGAAKRTIRVPGGQGTGSLQEIPRSVREGSLPVVSPVR